MGPTWCVVRAARPTAHRPSAHRPGCTRTHNPAVSSYIPEAKHTLLPRERCLHLDPPRR